MFGEEYSKEKAEERRKDRAIKESDKRRKKNIDRLEKAEKKIERKARIDAAKGRIGKTKEKYRKSIERMNTLYILFQKVFNATLDYDSSYYNYLLLSKILNETL